MQTLSKSERLCSFRLKELLFNKGRSFFLYPFRIVYYTISNSNLEPFFFRPDGLVAEGRPEELPVGRKSQNPSWPYRCLPDNAFFDYPAKIMVSVARRNFKRAVDRNKIKRLVKESYRKNKPSFYPFLQSKGLFCVVAFVYTSREIMTYTEVENKMVVAIQRIMAAIESQGEKINLKSES